MAAYNPSVVRCVIELQQATRPFNNIVHVRSGNVNPPAADLAIIAETVYNAYRDSFLPLLSNATVLQGVTAYSMASAEAPLFSFTPATPPTGGQGGDPLPLQSAAVLTLRTGARGRSGRGRMYISGWSEVDSVQSSLAPAPALALQTAANTFLSALGAALIPLQVYSQQSGKVERAQGVIFEVTDIALRTSVWGSQRDRNRREASA